MAKRHNTPSRPITTTKHPVRLLFRQKLAEVQQRHAKIDGLLQEIEDVENEIANRPLVSGVKLAGAECPARCTSCYLNCAMLTFRLGELERELHRLGGVPKFRLKRDGLAEAGRA